MPTLHKEILTPEQRNLLPAVKTFARSFGLVGGTAVALYLGHRQSVDFDLFTKNSNTDFAPKKLLQRFRRHALIREILVEEEWELTFLTKTDVKVTFYRFPHRIPYTERFGSYIAMPSLLTLAAMKAYALGARAKWKDYVDLYFIMREAHSLFEIVAHATSLFGDEFNEKLFRTQLAYFDDVNYTEAVTYLPGRTVSDEEVKGALAEHALA